MFSSSSSRIEYERESKLYHLASLPIEECETILSSYINNDEAIKKINEKLFKIRLERKQEAEASLNTAL